MSKKLNLKQKMDEINEKMTIKTKSNYNSELIENRMIALKKKMTTFSIKNEQQLVSLKVEAIKVLKRLQQNNISYQAEAQNQIKELQNLSQMLTNKVSNLIVDRKDKQNMMIQNMDKKLKFLKGQIQKEKNERIQVIQQITSTLKNDVPTLMNNVIDSNIERQEEEDKLKEIIAAQLQECQKLNADLKSNQQTNCDKIYELIRDLTLKAKKQIEEEKAIRQDTHDEILAYVEETCSRLGGQE